MIHNKNLNSIVAELFISDKKLNISLIFITQSYFKIPKDVMLNTSHFFIAKITNKRKLPQITTNHSSDINTKDFADIFRDMIHNKKLNSIVAKLFIKGIKLNISLVFITQSYKRC